MKLIKTEAIKKDIEPRILTIELTNDELNLIVASLGRMSIVGVNEEFLKKYEHKQTYTDTCELYNSLKKISDLKMIGIDK